MTHGHRASALAHLLPLSAFAILGAACGGEAHLDSFEGRLEAAIQLAEQHPGAFEAFADGSHDPDDIAKQRIPVPAGGSEIEQELLRIVAAADSFSEAILLARTAGQVPGDVPAAPAEVLEDADPADLEFAGRNVSFPYAVHQALAALRVERDAVLDELGTAAFEAYAKDANAEHRRMRALVAARLGWTLDERADRYIVQASDGTIWRRKTPQGYVAPVQELSPSSAPFGPAAQAEEQVPSVDFGEGVLPAIIGADTTSLRSRDNGYTMGGAAWEPKGAIVDDGRSGQEVPVEVDCSGTKITARLVATAGHCMFKDGSWNDNTKWIPGADGIDGAMNGRDPSPNGVKSRSTRIVRGNWFDHEWSNYDFGVFVLHDNASSCSLHWHGWRRKTPSGTVYLYGFPGERRQCAASPRANGWCGGSIYGQGKSVSSTNSYRMYYTIDTQPGHSGSGVYEITNGDRYVVGTHRGASGSENDGVYITSDNRDLIVDATNDHPANACN